MAKLTKPQTAAHKKACALLEKDVLSFDDRLFVLDNWQEGATHINGAVGAFFTPQSLARDFALEVGGNTILDLCAGIGSLSFAAYHSRMHNEKFAITCVEINPDYIEVGKKVLPEATWIRADALDLPANLTGFDCAIANPPFGSVGQTTHSPRYSGSSFEYKVIDIASDRAEFGVFLIPQGSASFSYSGRQRFTETLSDKYLKFKQQTGIVLQPNCGIDTSVALKEWHGVCPVTEIVITEFVDAREGRRPQEVIMSVGPRPTVYVVPVCCDPLLPLQRELFAA
jgi:SAM-dependent methyltransferase